MADPSKPYQFQSGNSGGPGRPKGARHKLSEAFVSAMLENFQKGGVEAIERVRVEDPSTYIRTIAGILPKEVTGEDGEALFSGITVNFVRPPDPVKS